MNDVVSTASSPTRERLLGALYEAAELEHNLMCTYLYAAFSLRSGEAEGLSPDEAAAVARWRRSIIEVAIDEMGHLAAVWNITAALGGAPRFGRGNFPLDPGMLPAGIVVKLAPFNEQVLQHFIFLERPEGSTEPDGAGFEPELQFKRGTTRVSITPMGTDYDTVGTFYARLGENLRLFVERHGESAAFCGDPLLQLSEHEVSLNGAKPVVCLKTALAAFDAIVRQGEGAREDATGSHYQRFLSIRAELDALKAANPAFQPARPAAVNPVLRPPLRPQGRVWLENEDAFATVDVANASYALMLRLLAYSYTVQRPRAEKSLAVDLALGLMRSMTLLAERAARLPAGPSNPGCNAGMSFTALRDAAPLLPGVSAHRYFIERFGELEQAATLCARSADARAVTASRFISGLARRAARGFASAGESAGAAVPSDGAATARAVTAGAAGTAVPGATSSARTAPSMTASSQQSQLQSTSPAAQVQAASQQPTPHSSQSQPTPQPSSPQPSSAVARTESGIPIPTVIDGTEHIEGEHLTLLYETKKCIHARFCVTGAPKVFIANVQGPWIDPDGIEVDKLVEIAHACPSGAIRYRRKDGKHDEVAPQVNLLAIREAGPYAVRAPIMLDGDFAGFRATLCRCGASKNKPFCDGSHHEVKFAATGEPPTGTADMLAVRDGPLAIDPQMDGPLHVRGNLEITSGTGRVVARVVQTKLCRCGGSNNKPFCDGTHARIGFKSD
ncbi:MAG TPA: ferritin-like domain-containing protein [Steroidobacteraceae bacterium]|nr:ferritin-like domain-containing protein [Steroidobacteraceae bacterium]